MFAEQCGATMVCRRLLQQNKQRNVAHNDGDGGSDGIGIGHDHDYHDHDLGYHFDGDDKAVYFSPLYCVVLFVMFMWLCECVFILDQRFTALHYLLSHRAPLGC